MGDSARMTGVSLAVRNPSALAEFYREALGVAMPEDGVLSIGSEGQTLQIHGAEDGASGWRVLLETESAGDAELRILGMGGSIESATGMFRGQLIRGRDPEGNAFALFVRNA